MVGQKYRNNREGSKDYGKVGTVVRFDEKAKSAILQFDDDSSTAVSTATLKRWWKKVQAEENEPVKDVVEPQTEVVNEPEVASDGTPYSEVMSEIIEDGKKATKKAVKKASTTKKPKADLSQAYELIGEAIEKAGFGYRMDEKSGKSMWVMVDGKKRCGIYIGSSKCSLGLSKTLAPTNIKADRVRNCPSSHVYDVSYDNMDKLVTVLSSVEFGKKKEEK